MKRQTANRTQRAVPASGCGESEWQSPHWRWQPCISERVTLARTRARSPSVR